MKKLAYVLLVLILLLILLPILYFNISDCGVAPWSCGDYTPQKEWNTQRIAVEDGPEDMAIDISTGRERIIVSCSPRRDRLKEGGFYTIDPTTNSASALEVIPRNLTIHPHGIDVVTIDSTPFLYAISHDEIEGQMRHRIFRFKIDSNTLILDEPFTLEHELMTGPNDLDVLEDGSLYVSNPLPSNDPNESTKSILGIKNGNVLHYDGKGNWEVALDKMCYPNGVWVNQESGMLVVANGGCQEVARYAMTNGKVNQSDKLSTKSHNTKIPIGDNLMMDNQGVLWTTSHPCPLKFLEHIQDSENPSPSQVFAMDPMTMKSNLVFKTNGELISAASTALRINNRLYVSQVLDPFVLVVEGVQL